MRFLVRFFRAIPRRITYSLLLLLSKFISPRLRLKNWRMWICFSLRNKSLFYRRMKHFLRPSLLIAMAILRDPKSINIAIFYFKAFRILCIFPLICSRTYFLSGLSLLPNHILHLLVRDTSTLIFFIKTFKFIGKNLLFYLIPFVISYWRTLLWGHLKSIKIALKNSSISRCSSF